MEKIFAKIPDFVLRGGKRVRPALFLEGFRIGGGKRTDECLRASLSIELCHNYFLMHDDIMDRDALSIERVSILREDEIERVVRKHFGEMGAERVMPDLEETLEEFDSRLSSVEDEIRSREDLLETLTAEIEDSEKTGSLDEIVDELVERKLKEKLGVG